MYVLQILVHSPLPRDIHTNGEELGQRGRLLHIRVVAALQICDGLVELGLDLRQLLLHLVELEFPFSNSFGLVAHHFHHARIEL